MSELKNAFIIIVVNDPITHWCDNAIQTIRILSKHNQILVFCSGNCVTWRDVLSFFRHPSFLEHKGNAQFFHPFFIIPGQRNPYIKKLNYHINAIVVNLWVSLFVKNKQKIFWFFDSFHISTILKRFPQFTSVYDCVDYYLDISEQISFEERSLLSDATYVFANSQTLAYQLSAYRENIHIVPLGFADDVFKNTRLLRTKHHKPVVGFVGGITPRIDFSLLYQVAKKCTEVDFVFYGFFDTNVRSQESTHQTAADKVFNLKNVFWKGYLPKNDMPRCIRDFDICCIPYQVSDSFNRYCFPMKVMEYFYFGKPVVSTPIEELKRYDKYIRIGSTAEQWIQFIQTLLHTPWPQRYQKEQRKIAEENSWRNKLSRMAEIIC